MSDQRSEEDPFESITTLARFLIDNDYAVQNRRGQIELREGGIAYLLCRIAVSVNRWSNVDAEALPIS